MNLQVLEQLGITERVVGLGTSQGGWVVTRMALLKPALVNTLFALYLQFPDPLLFR